jgi:hypothetical protein
VPKRVKSKDLGMALSKVIAKLATKGEEEASKVAREAVVTTWTNIITQTPVDSTAARGSWLIGGSVSGQLKSSGGKKGRSYVERMVPRDVFGIKLFLFNNQPYINMLEFGGYSTGPKTTGGFSKQAPNGMVRINLAKFPSLVRKLERRR